jgi:hypothetical protein
MYENYGLPGCDAVYFSRYVQLFQMNQLFPYSVETCSVLKKEAACSSKHSLLKAKRTLQIHVCQTSQKCQFKPTDADEQFLDSHTTQNDGVYTGHRTL